MENKKVVKSIQGYLGPIFYCLTLDIQSLSKLTERKRKKGKREGGEKERRKVFMLSVCVLCHLDGSLKSVKTALLPPFYR